MTREEAFEKAKNLQPRMSMASTHEVLNQLVREHFFNAGIEQGKAEMQVDVEKVVEEMEREKSVANTAWQANKEEYDEGRVVGLSCAISIVKDAIGDSQFANCESKNDTLGVDVEKVVDEIMRYFTLGLKQRNVMVVEDDAVELTRILTSHMKPKACECGILVGEIPAKFCQGCGGRIEEKGRVE